VSYVTGRTSSPLLRAVAPQVLEHAADARHVPVLEDGRPESGSLHTRRAARFRHDEGRDPHRDALVQLGRGLQLLFLGQHDGQP